MRFSSLEELEQRYAALEFEHQRVLHKFALEPEAGASRNVVDGARSASSSSEPVEGKLVYLWPAPVELISLATDPNVSSAGLESFALCKQLSDAVDDDSVDCHWYNKQVADKEGQHGNSSSNTAAALLLQRISMLSVHYLRQAAQQEVVQEAVRVEAWCELLPRTSMIEPKSHHGALLAGMMWTRKNELARSWVFMDPRGRHAPFGKTYSVNADEGVAAIFPAWISYYVDPGGTNNNSILRNRTGSSSILCRFLIHPPEDVWDWADDFAASIFRSEPVFIHDPD